MFVTPTSMRRLAAPFLLLATCLLSAAPVAGQGAGAEIDIPFERYVLDNGLTLIVHEDDKAPIVAVNVWYHVGSKNEKPGKTGFAHLFEHLMFNGSEHYDDDYFRPFEQVGATDMNGTTNPDRTNYFENVPTPALDLALWMESDRMCCMRAAIDQERLDEQRGVVQNEKRQGENQPYGLARQLLAENTYPEGHPYHWTTIGSMEDLEAASLEDVHEWFGSYYGAANAVVVVAGDVDSEDVRRRAEHFFGEVPPGPPVARQDVWIAPMQGTHRQVAQDRVPQARIYKVWNIPEWGSADADYLNLVSDVLSSGKTSRFYRRLVYDDQIATSVSAYVSLREIGGQFYVVANARPGQDLAEVERALDEELERFLEEGPTAEELARVQTQHRAGFIRGVERIGGFGGKSDVLAQGEVYMGQPDFYRVQLDRIADATAADLRNAAREWLSDGVYVLEVHPFPSYTQMATDVDRSRLPDVGEMPVADFPEIETAELSNGLRVVLAERHSVPVVSVNLLVGAGYVSDIHGAPGTASLAMAMLDEGTASRTALEISDELARLGAFLGTGANVDMGNVFLNALRENLDPSLAIMADVVLNPAFPQEDFQRLLQQRLAQIQREKSTPIQMALRVMPGLLYGEGHPYAQPLTGSGTEASVSALTPADLSEYHRTWFKPNNAALVVAGDVTLEEILPLLERHFGSWQSGTVPDVEVARVEHQPESVVYLMDRPGSQQSIIFAGHVAPPRTAEDEIAIGTLNDILGGSFTSRINMNLREDKHWSYGAFTLIWDTQGQRPFIAYAPVQTDRTAESIQEVMSELRGIVNDRPVTPEELAKAQANLTLSLPGRWETTGAVASDLADVVTYDLPHDYFDNYAAAVRALDLADLESTASELVHPDRVVWVIVGDLSEIEESVRALNLGRVRLLDADGNVIPQ